MRRSSNQKPSFFKVLSNMDFTKLLRVAPAFLGKYGLTPPENVKLRVHSGRAWRVKVERLENGLFCFTKSWPSFAKDAGLQLGEFLVLSLVREWEFDVAIYDTSFCEREIPAARVDKTELNRHGRNEKKRRRIRRSTTYGSSKESDPLYFEVHLSGHHESRVFVSQMFLDAAGLNGKKRVKLEYAENGSSKSVALNKQRLRTDLAKGWPEFRKANRLGYGKTYSFRFIPDDNVIRVQHVVRKNEFSI